MAVVSTLAILSSAVSTPVVAVSKVDALVVGKSVVESSDVAPIVVESVAPEATTVEAVEIEATVVEAVAIEAVAVESNASAVVASGEPKSRLEEDVGSAVFVVIKSVVSRAVTNAIASGVNNVTVSPPDPKASSFDTSSTIVSCSPEAKII